MIKNKLFATTVLKKSPRLWLKLFLWIFLLTFTIFIAIFLSGYIGASKPVSYMPEINLQDLKRDEGSGDKVEIKRSRFIVSVKGSGEISVITTGGEPIMSGLIYYSSHEGYAEKWGLDRRSVSATSDSTILINGESLSGSVVSMTITVPLKKSKIDVNIRTLYSSAALVRREALLAAFDVPVKEIFRKDRKSDTSAFDQEYWLQKEGVRFGSGERSALIYNAQDVSSLQADTRKQVLMINLDYSSDHPFFNIPFQKDGGGRWTDESEAYYKAGDTRKNSFSINFADLPAAVPRIMLVPGGYLAGYVFTEHADGGNIRTHRAAYFGSEDITNINDATGGFAGYKIPVTKSIFFPDIDVPVNSPQGKKSEKEEVLDFMDQLNSTGNYDICLHGANTERNVAEEWIRSMKTRFDTRTWIDHGMFAGTGNRQSFVCDGLDPSSKYFTADLWEKYNTKYFWNASVEEFRKLPLKENILRLRFCEASLNLWRRSFSAGELREMSFVTAIKELLTRYRNKGELNSMLPHRGNSFPTPLSWKHPTRTMDFYSWTTDYVKIFSHTETGVKDEEENLNRLISDRGIFINHGYFVRNLYEDGVMHNSNGKLTANPYFNQTLAIMALMQQKGDLYITTIRDLLDYWVLIENISFDYNADGTIYINNLNDKPVKGFSLAIRADKIKIDGEIPKCRRSGDETVFWFDMPAGKHVTLKIE